MLVRRSRRVNGDSRPPSVMSRRCRWRCCCCGSALACLLARLAAAAFRVWRGAHRPGMAFSRPSAWSSRWDQLPLLCWADSSALPSGQTEVACLPGSSGGRWLGLALCPARHGQLQWSGSWTRRCPVWRRRHDLHHGAIMTGSVY